MFMKRFHMNNTLLTRVDFNVTTNYDLVNKDLLRTI